MSDEEKAGRDFTFPILVLVVVGLVIYAMANDAVRLTEVDPLMDPPSAYHWESEALQDLYVLLYRTAVEACETPQNQRQPVIDRYAEQRQEFVEELGPDDSPPVLPTPERLISC